MFYTNCTPPVVSKNKDANQWTENWHWISSQRKPKTLRLGSVGEWSRLCPCSSSTVIWHMQRFALLQALRHWSKQTAPARPGNNNRDKRTNDFVPTTAWCLPPTHHGLPAYPLSPPRCLSPFLFHTPHIHPTLSSHHFLPSTECHRDWQTLWWTSSPDVKVHFKRVLCWSLLTSSPLRRWTCAGLKKCKWNEGRVWTVEHTAHLLVRKHEKDIDASDLLNLHSGTLTRCCVH